MYQQLPGLLASKPDLEFLSDKELLTAKRFNKGKTKYSSLQWIALAEVAKVCTMGAEKYGNNNWKKGSNYSTLIDSTMRHFVGDPNTGHGGFLTGELLDPESKIHHLAHCAWNVLTLLQQELDGNYKQFDDRFNDE